MRDAVLLQAFGEHQIFGQDCGGEVPTLRGAFSIVGDMLVWVGTPDPGYPVTARQGPKLMHLLKQTGDTANYVLGSNASCVIPQGRAYEMSMWGYVPTQSATNASDLRVAVIWSDNSGFHNQLQFPSSLDEWYHFHFENVVVDRGCTFFMIVIYNMGGDQFSPRCHLYVDRMEMWDKGEFQHLPGTEQNSEFAEDRMWSRTERLL